jgi:hypothetical protein
MISQWTALRPPGFSATDPFARIVDVIGTVAPQFVWSFASVVVSVPIAGVIEIALHSSCLHWLVETVASETFVAAVEQTVDATGTASRSAIAASEGVVAATETVGFEQTSRFEMAASG